MNCACVSRSSTLENSAESGKNKTAATSGGAGHGGKTWNSGRKRTISDLKKYKIVWFTRHRHIFLFLEEKIFQS